jgi:hypothetical protein
VIFSFGSLSNSLRNRWIHLGYRGHTHAWFCAMRAYTCGFVLVRLLERGREILATMPFRPEALLIELAFIFNLFFVRHRIDLVSYCSLPSRRPLGNRAAITFALS